jgi:hypothetical protein
LIYIYKVNKNMASVVKQEGAAAGGEKQAILLKLLQALLRIRERSLMKPDAPIYQVVQVPLLTQNSLTLLHYDDYHKDNVELSTFTPQDDIVLKLREKGFLVFDRHGNQLKARLDESLARDPAFHHHFLLKQV